MLFIDALYFQDGDMVFKCYAFTSRSIVTILMFELSVISEEFCQSRFVCNRHHSFNIIGKNFRKSNISYYTSWYTQKKMFSFFRKVCVHTK